LETRTRWPGASSGTLISILPSGETVASTYIGAAISRFLSPISSGAYQYSTPWARVRLPARLRPHRTSPVVMVESQGPAYLSFGAHHDAGQRSPDQRACRTRELALSRAPGPSRRRAVRSADRRRRGS